MSQNLAEKTDLGRKVGLGAVVAVATGPPVYYMWEKQNRKAAGFRLDSDASPSVKFF